jgi:DNA invertase Pin-like site-specific DNA recombinase
MMRTAPRASLHCAVYTRVSTDSGLEQDFNSLDNQREACAAYIKSQAHEGWRPVRERFDDGGFSGGSMNRPALQKLLDEVRGRKIDVIVVYKVDRLTRSLADFAKLVELFDGHGVSFISVTQAFNTTTSMGRLTLNMLLSFAQFEREITGERIRDKVAASKRKGIWMGGAVPLGYRVEDRALHVVEEDAVFVRGLFRRYLELGSVVRLKAALGAENVRSPIRKCGSGRQMGGLSMLRGHLYWILSNPIYAGRLRHKGLIHEGLHEAIIDKETWDRVQERLASQTPERRAPKPDEYSFLKGKLYDDRGHRMSPSHAAKGGRRWRYYVSRAALTGRKQDAGSIASIPAAALEEAVTQAIRTHLGRWSIAAHGDGASAAPTEHAKLMNSRDATRLRTDAWATNDIRDAIERVTVGTDQIEIQLSDAVVGEDRDRVLMIPWTPRSTRRRRAIIPRAGDARPPIRAMRTKARGVLIEAMRNAHSWLDQLVRDTNLTIAALAAREGKSERSIRMTLSLAFVAPQLARAAVDGRLPRGFSVERLTELPMLWDEQWRVLGLQAPAQGRSEVG